MVTATLTDQINHAYASGIPFVCFAHPDSELIHVYLQHDKQLHITTQFSEAAYVMAPFLFDGSAYCLPYSEANYFSLSLPKQKKASEKITIEETVSDNQNHIDLVIKAISEIERGALEKVVVSRKKRIPLQKFSIELLMEQLFRSNNEAFRYIWFHPETGLWCGATPEVLLTVKGSSFATMSLAGTKVFTPNAERQWTDKEIDEQRIVTDEIRDTLHKVSSILRVSNTKSHRAGNLVHLKTDISGILKKGRTEIIDVLKLLHPTPAVCGVPTAKATDFITKNEGYDRMFYTGFTGPMGATNEASSLYVNLRCMKIETDAATLFVGGGITQGSNPNAEWQETRNKLQTMLTVLEPMLEIES